MPDRIESPEDLFPGLFEAVSMQRLFPDSKTFCDMIPLASPDTIMAAWRGAALSGREALGEFVAQHFAPPPPLPGLEEAKLGVPLRQHITEMWDRLTRPAMTQAAAWSSELPLPYPYVVPGGRFREIYYWDSYFTMLGLAEDGRADLIEGMVDSFVTFVEQYGHVPNGSRSYYLSRSQPPFLAHMIALSGQKAPDVCRRRLEALKAEHDYWMRGSEQLAPGCAIEHVVRLPDGALLNRYWDTRPTPRPENFAGDMEEAEASGRDHAEVFRDIRAACESGWDFSSRWLSDGKSMGTIRTTQIAPVDLNCLMHTLEMSIARESEGLGDGAVAVAFEAKAKQRAEAIRAHLWHSQEGRFGDLLWEHASLVPGLTAATVFPLFAGIATEEQARVVAHTVRAGLLAPGGLRTTTVESGQQWDRPNGWAPLQWVAVTGLRQYGEQGLADEIAQRWLATVQADYQACGMLREKYDVEKGGDTGGGEYPNQTGFGWTNGVTLPLMTR